MGDIVHNLILKSNLSFTDDTYDSCLVSRCCGFSGSAVYRVAMSDPANQRAGFGLDAIF